MKRILSLVLFLLIACTLHAQVPYTVTGTVQSSTGGLATSGTVTFTIKPTSQSVLYYIAGTTIIAPQSSQCGINASGLIKNLANLANPCTVWGNDQITPGNTTYSVAFAPNGTTTNTIANLAINSVCTNLNVPCFTNSTKVVPQYQTITTSPIQVNLIPAANLVYNVGQSGLQYAAGYFGNLFVSNMFTASNLTLANLTLTGNLSVAGAASFTGSGSTGVLTAGTGLLSNSNTWVAAQIFSSGGTMNGLWLGTPTFNSVVTFNGSATGTHFDAGSFKDTAPNPAVTGFVNMVAGDSLAWRNAANTGDITISKNASDVIVHGTGVRVVPTTFGSLPTCNSGAEGTMWPITNSNTNTWGTTITTTGSDHVLAYCDGTNWTVAAM